MAVALFYNNASSTLSGPITTTSTTIYLAAGGGAQFTPAPTSGEYFVMTLVDNATGLLREIIHVTNVSGDVLTVVRAQEGTTALSWLAGDLIINEWTAGSASQMLQQGQLPGTIIYVAGTDTGTANNIVVTTSPVISSLTQGAIIEVTKGSLANSGALTIQQNGASAVAVTWANGNPLASGDWPANATGLIAYNSTSSTWQLISFPNSSNPNLVHYGVAGGTANALTATFSPAISAISDGLLFEVVPSASNTASTTINPNGLGAVAFEHADGSAFVGGELISGFPVLAMADSGVFRALTSALGGVINIQVFQTPGSFTYTKTPGARSALIFATGAGGAGGSGVSGSPGIGGSAASTAITFLNLAPISTVTGNIGAGGVPTSSGGYAGDGGQTSFGTYAVAGGGFGGFGQLNNGPGRPGGTATTGLILIGGGGSCPAQSNSAGPCGSNGGNSFWGGGGYGWDANTPSGSVPGSGGAGNAPGAGGGGADTNGSAIAGAAGAAGIVVVIELA